MAWTFQQEKAIYTRGQNIIVSAGAGSGKTAVLSERILDYCLKGNDIRNVLVLTFTNAAAMEMKERIRKKLLEHHLNEQASLIDSAFITTFDAYSLALVKKYYFRLELDKNIGIIDQALLEVKKRQLLDAMFTELYENKDKAFLGLVDSFALQDDKNIKTIIMTLLSKLELIVDEEEFIQSYEQKYYSESFIDSIVDEYEKLACLKLKEMEDTLNVLLDSSSTDLASVKLYDMVLEIKNRISNIDSYEEAYLQMQNITLPRLSASASEQVKYDKTVCTEAIKKIKETFFSKYLLLTDMKEELLATKQNVLVFLSLTKELSNRVMEYKKSIMQFDYIDIAKMAIHLVTKFQDVHDEIALQLQEILIDEYQDTSDLQEAFITAISNQNCYMVGDIKQSIYRFRNANPYIFKNKYEMYGQNDGGLKIDLTYNFRSRKEVLNNINDIFNFLMTDACGDADYSVDHQMQYGLKNYDALSQAYDFNMKVLTYEEVDGFIDEEVEAFLCGKKIQELIKSSPQRLNGNSFQPAKYSDIAILIDKTKSFVTFKRVFEYLGIPLSVEADMDLNNSILPKLFANILTVLSALHSGKMDVPYRHALCSIARSFLCEYPDEKIYFLAKNLQPDDLVLLLKELSLEATSMSYTSLFHTLCDKFSIYSKLSKIGDVENSLVVLEYIYNLFETITNAGMTLEEASSFFSNVFENGISLKYKINSAAIDSVHIMTIHKSKGLEFPYCFFPMLGGMFNQADMKQIFGLSPRYGIYIPYSKDGTSNTIVKTLVDVESRKADISEKVRLFYVALTRAREKIFLISKEQEYKESALKKEGYRCFNHMICSLSFLDAYKEKVNTEDLSLTKNYWVSKKAEKPSQSSSLSYDDISYFGEILGQKRISKHMMELIDDSLQMALDLGNEFHQCLEVLDFNDPNIDALPTSPQIKESLKRLLKNPVFAALKKAKTYHEYEFYFEDDIDSYHGVIDLFAEYEDHIDIIDYKLSSIDNEAYRKQLDIYKRFISSRTSKPVYCYLLSILKEELLQV